MLAKLRPRSVYDVLAAIGCFVALGGTSAYAINEWTGANIVDESLTGADVRGKPRTSTTAAVNGSLTTDDVAGQAAHAGSGTPFIDGTLTQWDVRNGALVGGDLANNTVGGAKVTDGSLTGADINESALGTVTASVLGGLGVPGLRQNGQTGPGFCDPEGDDFVNCDIVARLNLPRPARVLVIGSVRAVTDGGGSYGNGECLLGTTSGPIAGSLVNAVVEDTPGGNFGSENLAIAGVTVVLPAGQHAVGIDCNDYGNIRYEDAQVTAVALSDR
jgi:hypothetical protein